MLYTEVMARIITKNRKALFNYEIKDSYLAGLVLLGIETKSVRLGEIDLKGAFVTVKDDQLWLTNAHIKPYKFAGNISTYDPDQPRKLLLNRSEISKIITAKESGLTVVPLSVELHGKYIKLQIATARGKRKTDKRHVIRERDVARDTAREIKSRTNK
jgi:SsrA-binding protein